MKNITKLLFLVSLLSLSVCSFAQPTQTCSGNTYFTSNAGWTTSEYYRILDIDAAKLTDAALPKFSTSDGAKNAADTDFGSGVFTSPIMTTTDGTVYTPTNVLWPIKYKLAAFAPTMYTSAYTKINVIGMNPSGAGTFSSCTLNDNTVMPSPVFAKQGFIELCRLAATTTDPNVSRLGYIEIDDLPSVERIQWSYSGTSWKRGVKCDIKYDNGDWQPLRWEASDISIWIATFAEQGYQFEEIIGKQDDPNSKVSIRFRSWDGDSIHVNPVKTDGSTFTSVNKPLSQWQTVRIHQIKVFSNVIPTKAPVTLVATVNENNIKIYLSGSNIVLSEVATVEMFTVEGKKSYSGVTKSINVSGFPRGIYIIKAIDADGKLQNKKIAI